MKHNRRVALASALIGAGIAAPVLSFAPALASSSNVAVPAWTGCDKPNPPSDCPTVLPTTTTTSPAPDESLGATVGGITFTNDPGDPSDPATSTTAAASPTASASVLGESFTKVDAASDPAGLPFTGAEIGGMVTLSVALIGGGAILMITSRRRRGTHAN